MPTVTEKAPPLVTDGDGGNNKLPPVLAEHDGDGDDYVTLGVGEAEFYANYPSSNVIQVNRGLRRTEAFRGMRSGMIAPFAGYITTRHQVPPMFPN